MSSASSGNIETYGQLYSRLLRRNPESGELEPGLAESWEMSDDGTTYTFKLRDAKFSDGSPITADDVAFSLERIRTDKQSAYPAPLGAVESVSASDPKTVMVKLKSQLRAVPRQSRNLEHGHRLQGRCRNSAAKRPSLRRR